MGMRRVLFRLYVLSIVGWVCYVSRIVCEEEKKREKGGKKEEERTRELMSEKRKEDKRED